MGAHAATRRHLQVRFQQRHVAAVPARSSPRVLKLASFLARDHEGTILGQGSHRHKQQLQGDQPGKVRAVL